MRPRLIVQKLNGGLGRRNSSADMVTGSVMNAVATPEMVLGNIYTLKNIQEVESLGITQEYDRTYKVLVYERLRRFFVHNPSITVYFMPVAQGVTLTQMVDKDNNYLAKLLRDKAGEIVQVSVSLNPEEDYTPTIETGLDKDSIDAIYKAQGLADAEWNKDRYSEIYIEGRSFSGTSAAALNLRTLLNECPDISVVIGADYAVSTRDELYKGYAAVEDYTAMISKAAVSQNAGEQVNDFNLTNAGESTFIIPALSSGNKLSDYSDTDLDNLDERGYIYFAPIVNLGGISSTAGIFINDTHTCAKITSDFAYGENNRTIKKAIKLAKAALTPKVKGRIYVDENTGFMAPETVKDLETITKVSLDPMVASGDISGGVDAYINPEQNVLATSEFIVLLTFIPVAIGRRITLKVGFRNPLNNN
ncbi:DUF2586 family protein [Chryseobacterium lathyri]|uniref:DUF2586 family protein n=1 Tax=Chryseobacterium lathyri TaxID=395933 RepID=A0A511Y8R4_9FLAO|nr:DUF2586 family protein [Chryseobacterium lathyri]GEN71580.1 hypothetical protein CLA01_16520 [Chryseobacterium lathyri]